jgi:hypothetical protein
VKIAGQDILLKGRWTQVKLNVPYRRDDDDPYSLMVMDLKVFAVKSPVDSSVFNFNVLGISPGPIKLRDYLFYYQLQ